MANHTGFIFIAPNGAYLVRSPIVAGSQDHMKLCLLLDMASLFPTPDLPTDVDWAAVVRALSDMGDRAGKDAKDCLIPLPAKSFQRIEIGVYPEIP